jgi:signal transduction histidine kinase
VEKSGAAGGIVAGAAIVLMHYTGMAALDLPARGVWNGDYVAASILIGVALPGLALHVARQGGRHAVVLGAGLFALAIIAMHFTAMSAVTYIPDGSHVTGAHVINKFALAVVVTASAAFIVAQGLLVALVDRHLRSRAEGEEARMREHIAELEETQKKLNQTSNELTRALGVAAQANQAKGAFLASMSHELRTPLNAIIGFSDTMVMEVFGPMGDRYKSYAGDIRHSGEHLLALINDVLDLSRLDAGQAELREEEFDTAELIAEALRMMVGQAGKAQITLTTHIAQALPWVKADKRRIKQIVINLVSNALKFTPAGGTVDVTAKITPAGDLAVAVADSGIGIAPEDLPKVMERFGQVDSPMQRKHEGTGLGLPLSKQLAQLHGGDLTLESVLDQGTTVTLTLPKARLSAQSAIAAA